MTSEIWWKLHFLFTYIIYILGYKQIMRTLIQYFQGLSIKRKNKNVVII